MKTYRINEFGSLINRSVKTLQRWDREGVLVAHRNPKNRRYYTHHQYLEHIGVKADDSKKVIVYSRVSSSNQKNDLNSQREALEKYCQARGYCVDMWINEIGSGLNYDRKQFNKLLEDIEVGQVSKVIVAHKDRLVRFGFEWFENFAKRHGAKIEAMNYESLSPEQEMTKDMLSIIDCFSSRLYGLRKYKKQLPKVKLSRSFTLDENCYNLFEHEERQYINIMSLTPRHRIAIPLTGNTPIKGNIKIVLKKNKIEVHYSADIKRTKLSANDTIIAIDFGYTEVMTDSDGQHYGNGFGTILSDASDALKIKMQRRNKLHALQKKYAQSTDHGKRKKAKNIATFNLGTKKLEETRRRLKSTIQCKINKAYNELLEKNPNTVISESLSHPFHYGFGRNMNRRLSAWVRGELKERLAFKALVKGFDHHQVNPAYCSQTCLLCDYVDSKNRKGDKFACRHCGHVGHADWIAAMNLKRRYFDPEITRLTPYRDVKRILLERFHRHLETKQLGTVSAGFQIPESHESTMRGQSESEFKNISNVNTFVYVFSNSLCPSNRRNTLSIWPQQSEQLRTNEKG